MKKILFLPILLITCLSFSQDAKKIIGKPVKIGNLLVAQFDFPKQMNWYNAKAACRDLGKGWRLPNDNELNILYDYRKKIGGFTDNNYSYWSSTENNDYNNNGSASLLAWFQFFANGIQDYGYKHLDAKVRAVKTF